MKSKPIVADIKINIRSKSKPSFMNFIFPQNGDFCGESGDVKRGGLPHGQPPPRASAKRSALSDARPSNERIN